MKNKKWIEKDHYEFEWNDLRAFINIVNLILILTIGLKAAWLGLIVAVIGLSKDIAVDHRINGVLMHCSSIIMNLYFISIM